MKKIKLRAYIDGRMAYFSLMDIDECHITNESVEFARLPDDEDIMVYTGLKDRNGKEIYEGDILQDADDETNVGEAGFELGRFYCTCEMGTDFYKWVYRHGEVIGNIYENPEILEIKHG